MEDDIGVLIMGHTCCVSGYLFHHRLLASLTWPFLSLFLGLLAIKEAHDIETRLNEVEKLLETVISMPCKVSEASRRGRKAGVSHHQPDLKTGPCISLKPIIPTRRPSRQSREGRRL